MCSIFNIFQEQSVEISGAQNRSYSHLVGKIVVMAICQEETRVGLDGTWDTKKEDIISIWGARIRCLKVGSLKTD